MLLGIPYKIFKVRKHKDRGHESLLHSCACAWLMQFINSGHSAKHTWASNAFHLAKILWQTWHQLAQCILIVELCLQPFRHLKATQRNIESENIKFSNFSSYHFMRPNMHWKMFNFSFGPRRVLERKTKILFQLGLRYRIGS